jgi:ADP-ribosylglycohydrolase
MTISLLLIALYLFLHSGDDYLRAVEGAITLGGDTDGTAATAGALCAARSGAGIVPPYLAEAVEERERILVLAHLLHQRSLERVPAAAPNPLRP